MKEDLLHFVWQHQYFDKAGLLTSAGQTINILNPGFPHQDAGPDFAQARITIDGIEWNGHVELHVKSSDWRKHGHDTDPAYQNVILHVVWEYDIDIYYTDNRAIPTLELKHKIKPSLLRDTAALLRNEPTSACADSIAQVGSITITSMVERAVMSRLELKAQEVLLILKANKGDWEQTTYQWFMQHMGFKKNAEAMRRLAFLIPLSVIRKVHRGIDQLEALLFGVSGFLNTEEEDDYNQRLQNEYTYLKQKFSLQNEMSIVEWKYLRLRPANFPTLRIAQVAQILHKSPNLFSMLTEIEDVKMIREHFSVHQSEYWRLHYQFGKPSERSIPSLGKGSIDNLLINVCATILVAYGKTVNDQTYVDRALDLLSSVKAEVNSVTREWISLGQSLKTAVDSQGFLGLYKLYCQPRQCLNCGIGVSILDQTS